MTALTLATASGILAQETAAASSGYAIDPLIILTVGIVTVLGMILALKINAFLALITAAIIVSLMAPGPVAQKISRVAEAFGASAGGIAIVIALAAIIGECMMLSGAADRIVQAFLNLLGVKRAPWALMSSGFVLAIPVFFDTVFYLLVPLARSLYRRTGKNYLLSILAIAAGGAITHTLVPPTPGPLLMADQLGIDVGMMILIGTIVAMPAAVAGLAFSRLLDAKLDIPYREVSASGQQNDDLPELPSLWLSALPVFLPVLLISANTAAQTALKTNPDLQGTADILSLLGNPNLALLFSTLIAMYLYRVTRQPSLTDMGRTVEQSLMSAGVIILITAGGGAFGAMLKAAQVGDRIEGIFQSGDDGTRVVGMTFLLIGYGIAALLKVAQGSSTVAMITGSAMLAAMVGTDAQAMLGFHPVYLATAIGAGSLLGSWMNDSGFWIFAKMGGLTEGEALKTWTIMLAVLSVVSLAVTLLLANVMPLTSAA